MARIFENENCREGEGEMEGGGAMDVGGRENPSGRIGHKWRGGGEETWRTPCSSFF